MTSILAKQGCVCKVSRVTEMTQHFVSQVRKFPDFLTISKRTVAAVPGKRTKE